MSVSHLYKIEENHLEANATKYFKHKFRREISKQKTRPFSNWNDNTKNLADLNLGILKNTNKKSKSLSILADP